MELRDARLEDHEAVAAFTRNTWPDREVGDYLPDIYPEWIEGENHTLVAEAGEDVAGVAQCTMLSETEAWCQGMRVNPEYRGEGVARRLTHALFDWARDQGALVARSMVFSWNVPSMGLSRRIGFDPAAEYRWAIPEPDPNAEPGLAVTAEPDAAWHAWTDSDARNEVEGLALDPEETWAVSELSREDLRRAADETAVFAVRDDGLRGMSYRVRDYGREGEDGVEHWAEYGIGAWNDLEAGRALFDAIARDAAEVGADRTRVWIPETTGYVSDAAYLRAGASEEPDLVFAADLTADRTHR
ncbi:GNAT family N-acetyltransferase [Halalkalicoccus subterraneus]|uniref:GNAT family N-acetyltransferase n=1 Tax=Halalkalicoccus subterraneus TaxID=2675002 RepID=UPI000EFC6BF1|nr:GNAT family N-acetyltransferase [Halalkalicoccus subterraneus]